MSRALIVTLEAEADIFDGFQSYEEKQAALGVRFLDEIEQSLNRIAPNPYLYQEVEPDIRRAVVHTFPYLVFYTFDADAVHDSQSFMEPKTRLTSRRGLAPNTYEASRCQQAIAFRRRERVHARQTTLR